MPSSAALLPFVRPLRGFPASDAGGVCATVPPPICSRLLLVLRGLKHQHAEEKSSKECADYNETRPVTGMNGVPPFGELENPYRDEPDSSPAALVRHLSD